MESRAEPGSQLGTQGGGVNGGSKINVYLELQSVSLIGIRVFADVIKIRISR